MKTKYLLALFIFILMSIIFYITSLQGHFRDVESHIPATILAQKYDYDTKGYGLSFVNALNVEQTYGNGAFEILQKNIPPSSFAHYTSTIGLQGFIWAFIFKSLHLDNLKPLYAINAIINALAITLLIILISKIFSLGFGGIFFISLLSTSWIAKFNASLYFVFASWLLPALFAFYIYIYIYETSRKTPMLVCLMIGFTLAIFIRSLMSYEFLTSIVLFSLSPFLIVILYLCLNNQRKIPLMRTITLKSAITQGIALFILSIIGFLCAFLWHTYIRGNGDLLIGLKDIYEHDFLRRMIGGKTENFDPVYWDSLNASALSVIKTYLKFPTIKFLLPLNIFICLIETNKSLRSFYISLLIVFALPALSWFVFGKAHSYVHLHFCFVLWYLGFIATLIYVPLCVLSQRYRGKIYAK